MKLLLKSFIILLSLFNSITVRSQKLENFDKLIVNVWTLEKYEMNDVFFPPKTNHENDKMIFTENHDAESISNGFSQKGIWEYDKEKAILKVVDKINNITMILKVISISENQCVFEIENPKDQKIKLYMKTESKN